MITNHELNAVNFSATKKDFYQIWNELLDIAGKISDRWDPKSTNESDPGIVLLKCLTAIGDMLNYNIDSNILEAFMPSAAQMESMRALCERMGYNVKYYQSAITEVTFAYIGDFEKLADLAPQFEIPQFTTITNIDKDISYVTLEPRILNENIEQKIPCIEGQIVRCESDNNNIITINQLDDINRYFLPENQVAENGIFVYQIKDGIKSRRWDKVSNLNTQIYGSYVFKFGFDSKMSRPYIQFPEDISQLIEDGLEIYYIRTSGLSGNISAKTLNTFEKPSNSKTPEIWDKVSVDDFNVVNASAAVNGHNIETITEAYENYKKTIGTFDTLVTCRDYMNAIYNLMDPLNNPMVSNIIVSDIRDDINRSANLCSFDNYGINYIDIAVNKNDQTNINQFDLMLYPFKTIYGLNTTEEFKNSFKLDNSKKLKRELEAALAKNKTIAHTIKYPDKDEIVCIKNYLKLNARITTEHKVNVIEEQAIISAVKAALFKAFNLRKLDFGEAIPFESILTCIESSDYRIKNVALDDPVLYTRFETASGREFDLGSYEVAVDSGDTLDIKFPGKELYNKLAIRNILAGKLALFNYDRTFKVEYNEKAYGTNYNSIYPTESVNTIVELKPSCELGINQVLTKNELIKFRAPNFKTEVTYPAYVNYFFKQGSPTTTPAIPATFITLAEYMSIEDKPNNEKWNSLAAKADIEKFRVVNPSITSETEFKNIQNNYGAIFIKQENSDSTKMKIQDSFLNAKTVYYILPLNNHTLSLWDTWLHHQQYAYTDRNSARQSAGLAGLFRSTNSPRLDTPVGYLINKDLVKFIGPIKTIDANALDPKKPISLHAYYVQQTFEVETSDHTCSGLGRNAVLGAIPANCEYQLKPGDFLAINYTPAKKADGSGADPLPINILYDSKNSPIIRPNFELRDSMQVNTIAKKRYHKLDGFSFEGEIEALDYKNLPGMYSLDTSEQIEIRRPIEVELTDPITYLYWTLNDEQAAIKASIDNKRYTLSEGEYLYFTDAAKTSMAYYGNGSELIFENGACFISTAADSHVTAEDILNNGISVIPWKKFAFGSGIKQPKIKIREYQYQTLVEGDSIISLDNWNTANTITKNWTAVNSAVYNLGGVETTLPVIDFVDKEGNKLGWEVSSKLAIDAAPNRSQTLTSRDKLEVVFDTGDSVILSPNAVINDKPISFKTSYPIQTTRSSLVIPKEHSDKKLLLKVFETADVGIVDTSNNIKTVNEYLFNLHNFGENWTSLTFNSLNSSSNYLNLNITVPQEDFALVMIHYSGEDFSGEAVKDGAYIVTTVPKGDKAVKPVIFNNRRVNSSQYPEIWWDDKVIANKYYLRKGINIIKIAASCTLEVHPDSELVETVIISDVDLVNATNPINNKLIDYQKTTLARYDIIDIKSTVPDFDKTYIAYKKDTGAMEKSYKKYTGITEFSSDYVWFEFSNYINSNTESDQILLDINSYDLDHKFYYNTPIDYSSDIDFYKETLGNESEKLSTPSVWYDYNNINNKFVISELDYNYLDDGIKIAKTSKR